MRVGFLGLGKMGLPMALNLSRKFPLTAWNRTLSKYSALENSGIRTAPVPSQVLKQSDTIFLMLSDDEATRSILNDDFRKEINGKTFVNTSSVSVQFSHELAAEVHEAGGKFIEMPVSGSEVPAQQGKLVGMMAGDPTVAEQIKPLVEPITSTALYCGPIGSGLRTKYAVNLFLVSVTAGLAESLNLARAQGLNLEVVGKALNASSLASDYSKVKVPKIVNQDWSTQGAVGVCYGSMKFIHSAANDTGTRSPVLDVCMRLFEEAIHSGIGEEDMIAIYKMLNKQPSESSN